VPKPIKPAGVSNATAEELPFEDALGKLESIVDAMERDDLPLEMLLARFEEGTRLARLCQARLAEAELKIQQLEKQPDGELTLKPLAVTEPDADH
jgi:exodeoxyribonuclease VII small subunit